MIVDYFNAFTRYVSSIAMLIYSFVFPEYPEIGLAVVLISAVLFAYYTAKGSAKSAAKLALSVFVTLSFLLYVLHCLIKIYHVAI